MDTDQRNREVESKKDLSVTTDLAELGCGLVLCLDAISVGIGSFCTVCTCELGYHLSCTDGACETCGCDGIYKLCSSCGENRPIEAFGSKECKFCVNMAPIKIPHINSPVLDGRSTDQKAVKYYKYDDPSTSYFDTQERSKQARLALRELTE